MKKIWIQIAVCFLASTVLSGCTDSPANTQNSVTKIKDRGYLTCGSSQGVPGLSRPDEKGIWRGFDSDICRSVATAILGNSTKVRFVPLNSAQMLPAVQTGEVDILSRTATVSLTRDNAIRFAAITQYDTEAIIIRKSLNINETKQLGGRTFCMQGGGSSVDSIVSAIEAESGIVLKRVYFDSTIAARDAYFSGRCDGYVTDGLAAASVIATVAKNPEEHHMIFLNRLLPQAAWIARGDDKLFDIVRWTVNLLIWAEANGITQENIDSKAKSGSPEVRQVLGDNATFGRILGLDQRWAYNVIKQVGNYGEIWNRNLGDATPIKAERRLNNLQSQGGLLVSYPWEI